MVDVLSHIATFHLTTTRQSQSNLIAIQTLLLQVTIKIIGQKLYHQHNI